MSSRKETPKEGKTDGTILGKHCIYSGRSLKKGAVGKVIENDTRKQNHGGEKKHIHLAVIPAKRELYMRKCVQRKEGNNCNDGTEQDCITAGKRRKGYTRVLEYRGIDRYIEAKDGKGGNPLGKRKG